MNFQYGPSDVVLARVSSGKIYFVKIKSVSYARKEVIAEFDDGSVAPVQWCNVFDVKAETDVIVCVVCKTGISDLPNEIILCDSCNVGFHQQCHVPVLTSDVIKQPKWYCHYCLSKSHNPHIINPFEEKPGSVVRKPRTITVPKRKKRTLPPDEKPAKKKQRTKRQLPRKDTKPTEISQKPTGICHPRLSECIKRKMEITLVKQCIKHDETVVSPTLPALSTLPPLIKSPLIRTNDYFRNYQNPPPPPPLFKAEYPTFSSSADGSFSVPQLNQQQQQLTLNQQQLTLNQQQQTLNQQQQTYPRHGSANEGLINASTPYIKLPSCNNTYTDLRSAENPEIHIKLSCGSGTPTSHLHPRGAAISPRKNLFDTLPAVPSCALKPPDADRPAGFDQQQLNFLYMKLTNLIQKNGITPSDLERIDVEKMLRSNIQQLRETKVDNTPGIPPQSSKIRPQFCQDSTQSFLNVSQSAPLEQPNTSQNMIRSAGSLPAQPPSIQIINQSLEHQPQSSKTLLQSSNTAILPRSPLIIPQDFPQCAQNHPVPAETLQLPKSTENKPETESTRTESEGSRETCEITKVVKIAPVTDEDKARRGDISHGLELENIAIVTKECKDNSIEIEITPNEIEVTSIPIQTTPKDIEVTLIPIQTTPKDIEVTSKPIQTTPKEIEITSKPIQTTSKEIEVTSKPIQTTPKEIEVTSKPIQTTPKEIEVISKPIQTTSKDGEVISKPIQTTPKEIEVISKPIQTTSKESEVTSKPIQTTPNESDETSAAKSELNIGTSNVPVPGSNIPGSLGYTRIKKHRLYLQQEQQIIQNSSRQDPPKCPDPQQRDPDIRSSDADSEFVNSKLPHPDPTSPSEVSDPELFGNCEASYEKADISRKCSDKPLVSKVVGKSLSKLRTEDLPKTPKKRKCSPVIKFTIFSGFSSLFDSDEEEEEEEEEESRCPSPEEILEPSQLPTPTETNTDLSSVHTPAVQEKPTSSNTNNNTISNNNDPTPAQESDKPPQPHIDSDPVPTIGLLRTCSLLRSASAAAYTLSLNAHFISAVVELQCAVNLVRSFNVELLGRLVCKDYTNLMQCMVLVKLQKSCKDRQSDENTEPNSTTLCHPNVGKCCNCVSRASIKCKGCSLLLYCSAKCESEYCEIHLKECENLTTEAANE